MAERVIDAGGGVALAVADEPGERIAVVLAHGLTAARRYVVMGSSRLRRAGHRVVAYDARGHGSSSPPDASDAYGYDELNGDLARVLDTCGTDRVVLAGVSMGAHTCLRFALEQPERVAGIVVITPGFDPVEFADPARLARWDALSDALRDGGIEAFVDAFGVQRIPEQWRETVGRALRQRMAVHEHLDAVAEALRRVPRSAPFADLHALEEIECPAIVIGSRDEADPGHPLELARLYAELLPAGRLVVEDEGSSPLAWQGARVSKLIQDVAARALA
ncbi:MAG TPA: alpha/beta hydrolase [Solirubrobacteraceae bacterium]|nr:alpha/beta hydrolase [Solirubrobacteraceae bacterium]